MTPGRFPASRGRKAKQLQEPSYPQQVDPSTGNVNGDASFCEFPVTADAAPVAGKAVRNRPRRLRTCFDCGSTTRDTDFPARKPNGQRTRCAECAADAARQAGAPAAAAAVRTPVQTRASYRSLYRRRLADTQMDLVDLVVPPP